MLSSARAGAYCVRDVYLLFQGRESIRRWKYHYYLCVKWSG